MPRTRISTEDKRRLIDAHNNGENYEVTARVLGIARGIARSIISRHQTTGVSIHSRGSRKNVKVDEEMTQQCVQIVEDHPEFTLNQIEGFGIGLTNEATGQYQHYFQDASWTLL